MESNTEVKMEVNNVDVFIQTSQFEKKTNKQTNEMDCARSA